MLSNTPFPFQFKLFGNEFHYHYLFETLAFIVGVRLYYHLKKGIVDPISDENRLWIMLGAMLGALFGSRVIAILETPALLSQLSFSVIYQSKTIVGGLLGGLFGVELIKKLIGVHIASGDIYVLPIITALFIGRIGCFSMGVDEPTYGVSTSLFLGMDLGDGIKRHPIMLYEMAYLTLLFLFFRMIKYRHLINGDRFKLFMVLYFLFRFFIEFLKPYQAIFLGLSIIHWSALLIFLYYYIFIIRMSKSFATNSDTYG